ncbi:hypothetical protein ACFV2X_38030 [Streptomyces sp. NPDC059679]|uniref:hypothetical protein n=1 Tax=Streptomyces sp. NPDC059679 TaxID=3346903 RepID=UPI003684B648
MQYKHPYLRARKHSAHWFSQHAERIHRYRRLGLAEFYRGAAYTTGAGAVTLIGVWIQHHM